MKYTLLCSNTITELEDKINDLLDKGWELKGNTWTEFSGSKTLVEFSDFSYNKDGDVKVYHQAMVKK